MVFLAAILVASCGGGDYTPLPQAYLRIDTPEPSYSVADVPALPFTFEKNAAATLTLKRNTPHEVWVDLEYPQWDGVVFLSYKHLKNKEDLRGQTDTSLRLLESHYQFSSGVGERAYNDPINRVYGTVYHLHGSKVASTYQFWATDSLHHFLRGAFYLNRTPNNDSLAPVIEYVQADVDRLVESLRWR